MSNMQVMEYDYPAHNGKQVLKQILDKKFAEVHVDTLEQLQQKFPFLIGRKIFCKFDLRDIPNLLMRILKVQGNQIYYEEEK